MSSRNGGFTNAEDWYAALIEVAESHLLGHMVRDEEAWTSDWENESRTFPQRLSLGSLLPRD